MNRSTPVKGPPEECVVLQPRLDREFPTRRHSQDKAGYKQARRLPERRAGDVIAEVGLNGGADDIGLRL